MEIKENLLYSIKRVFQNDINYIKISTIPSFILVLFQAVNMQIVSNTRKIEIKLQKNVPTKKIIINKTIDKLRIIVLVQNQI